MQQILRTLFVILLLALYSALPAAEESASAKFEPVTPNTLTYRVNGTIVNRATDVFPDHGKILLQTEGAELFVRKLELRPLPAELP